MAAVFDAYHRWLGIAPEEQPPDHYRLLGLKVFEGEADVIESAADRQMTHVRSFQSGEHADHAERVLNEISAAKLTLLDGGKKAAYDSQLRARKQQTKKKKHEQPLQVAQPLPMSAGQSAADPLGIGSAGASPSHSSASPSQDAASPGSAGASPSQAGGPLIDTHAARKKSGLPPAVLYGAVACIAALLLVGGAIAMIARPWESAPEVAGSGGTDGDAKTENGPGENTDAGTVEVAQPQPPPPPPAIPKDGDNTTPEDQTGEQANVAQPGPGEDSEHMYTHGGEVVPGDDGPPVEVAVGPPPPSGPPKDRVPDKPSRDAARTKIAGIFPLDDADTPAQKAALAAQLLDVARDTENDAVARFVLLNLARENAAGAGQARQAMAAVDMLEAGYDFDVGPVRLATLGAAVKAPLPPNEKRDVVIVGIEMMDAMIARDEYQAAGKLVEPLVDIARRVKEKALLDALAQRRQRASELYSAYRKAQTAIETLKDDPDNADANLAAGRFYLFAKGNWSRALPLLAKSSNAKLAAAAQGEIQKPSTTAQEEKLADAWWEIAAAETDEDAQHLLKSRSMAWYRRALDELTGLAKAKAQNRIQQLADAGIRPGDLAADLGFFSRPPTGLGTYPLERENQKPSDKSLIAHWTFDEGRGTVTRDVVGGQHGTIKGGTWTKGVHGSALSFDGRDDAVEIPFVEGIGGEGHITLAAWVRAKSLRAKTEKNNLFTTLISRAGDDGATFLRYIDRGEGQNYSAGDWIPNQHTDQALFSVPRSDIGQWVHLAGTYDGAAWRIYRNGRFVASQKTDRGAQPAKAKWTLGGPADNSYPFHFHGDMDDVRVYNRSLAAEEVAKLAALPDDAQSRIPPRRNDNGLVAHWTFDEGRGTRARDAVGEVHGLVKGATWIRGVHGAALAFDGLDDKVFLGNPDALNFEGDISLCAWIRPRGLPTGSEGAAFSNIISHGFDPATNRAMYLRLEKVDSGVMYEVGTWTGVTSQVAKPAVHSDLGRWIHLAGTHDGESWRLYRNGEMLGAIASKRGGARLEAGWAIGGHGEKDVRFFHGDIDDVRIYNRALSPDEVAALAKAAQ